MILAVGGQEGHEQLLEHAKAVAASAHRSPRVVELAGALVPS